MSRPVAVVTGTSSGIGKATAALLLESGWSVHGLSRREVSFSSEHYHHTAVDLADTQQLTQAVDAIRGKHSSINALVNNAGVGHFAPHEELSVGQIEELIAVNLTAPLLMTKLFLRDLKEARGAVITISSFSAHESSSFGAAYAATKAGLLHFSRSLFEESRKSGLRVCSISPDITRTPFYDALSFAPEDDVEAAIAPESVAHAVLAALQQPEGTVVTELVMRPQRILLKKRSQKARSS
jgi:short-subunit dehydrogenase